MQRTLSGLAVLAFALTFTISQTGAATPSPSSSSQLTPKATPAHSSPKPLPAQTCIGGFTLTEERLFLSGHYIKGYSCTSGHVECPTGYFLIQGGDAGPKFFLLQGPKPGDRSVFIYHCIVNP